MKKRLSRICLTFNNEQKQQYRRKGFRRFWLEKNDDTDGFLRFLTEDFSTRVCFKTRLDLNLSNPSIKRVAASIHFFYSHFYFYR